MGGAETVLGHFRHGLRTNGGAASCRGNACEAVWFQTLCAVETGGHASQILQANRRRDALPMVGAGPPAENKEKQ